MWSLLFFAFLSVHMGILERGAHKVALCDENIKPIPFFSSMPPGLSELYRIISVWNSRQMSDWW